MKDYFNNFNQRKFFLVILTLLVVGISSFSFGTHYGAEYGYVSPASVIAGTEEVQEGMPPNVDFDTFWQVWHILDEKYVATKGTTTPITNEERVWGAIQGLASSLGDPYTVFLPPEENEIFSEDISGDFEGVGMEIGRRDGYLIVIAPLKGTPSEKAGIHAGDIILEINGESAEGVSVDSAVKRIRGKRGTKVDLVIAREGENEFLDISIVRDVIKIPTIETTQKEGGIFVIELYNFSAISESAFRGALEEFVVSGSHKLILDLRGNPGGFLEAAVDMASWFLPAGEVVLREDFGEHAEPQVHRSKGYDIFNDNLEMVILIDEGSASASEILAGALKEHGVATLVGENSFGKGSVQELVPVTEDTSLKVTIARWMTPNNTSISEGGLKPDVEVKRTSEDIEAGRDPQLDKALEILRAK